MTYFTQKTGALIWRKDYETVQIEPWGRNSLRFRSTIGAQIRDDLPQALLEPVQTECQITVQGAEATIRNGAIQAVINESGEIHILNAEQGSELLSELGRLTTFGKSRIYQAIGGDLYRLECDFKAPAGEKIYGMGQPQHGFLNQKGCVIDLVQFNSEVVIPFYISNRGYGFLWNNPSIGRVEFGRNRTRWVAEGAYQNDWWVTAGSPAEMLEQYADATGHARMLPDWAAGFWQCKLRYRTQEELLEVAREYKRRQLPLSVIVIDYFHWTAQGDWRFDERYWPDPDAMVKELNEMGVRVMVSIWPSVTTHSQNFEEMMQRGMLVRADEGTPALKILAEPNFSGRCYIHFYDPTNPEARQYVWNQVCAGYYQHGIKVFWLDACEPAVHPVQPENQRYHLGSGRSVSNLYPLMNAKTFFDGLQAMGEEEIITLSRSAWAGSQRYGVAVWSGDIPSTFESLQAQVCGGLNIALCGIPWWTTDIGGFFTKKPDTEYFRELLVRWFQFGVFCPLFRLHGWRAADDDWWDSGGPNEVWSYGKRVYNIASDLLYLREGLRPYIQDQMRQASDTGLPPMRPIFVDYPLDEQAFSVDDQFLFGPDLLVAPVLQEGATSRNVYLPVGQTWLDAWSGEEFVGGQWLSAQAPLERIPVYQRKGSSLPLLPALIDLAKAEYHHTADN